MSEVRMNVRDWQRELTGTIHGSYTDAVVGALAADPETIDELQVAVGRFIKPVADWPALVNLRPGGVCEEPWDAGLVVVDLAARLVAYQSSYSSPGSSGYVWYHNGHCGTNHQLGYALADDWLILPFIDGWRTRADQRRAERAANPPLDTRAVLYGQVSRFIVERCLARAGAENDPVSEIHAQWLMTPRKDLRDQSPRQVLLARREHIRRDLGYRADQWVLLGQCPPGLDRGSAAYRFSGYGQHEHVLYYELVRFLLEECWSRVQRGEQVELKAEINRLQQLQHYWLDTNQDLELHGMSPAEVIARERARLPMALTGEQRILDHDCPLCQMMADMGGPMFWHIDGCHMDEDFAFSFHPTREQWEAEQREWAEMDRQWQEKEATRQSE